MRRARLRDIDVAYREAGPVDAPAVVFVHGLAEDSATWQPQLDTLAGYHLYAYDVRGHGATDPGAGEGKLEQLAADLGAFLETVSGPAICVGFSLGGTIVLAAAADYPNLVRGVVVLGTSTVVGRGAAGFYTDRIAHAAELGESLRADTAAGLFRTDVDINAVTELRRAAVGDGRGYRNAARAMLALHEQPLTPRLADIGAPVQVIGAEHDAFCPRKAADIILAGLPQAAYTEIPAAGHLMNIDNPQVVTAALAGALKGMS